MTKKKKILNGVIFLVGLIVFAIYYFKDNTDMKKVEKAQDDSAKKAADSIFKNAFNEEEFNAEQVTICECENIFWDYSEKKDNAKTEEERTQLSREESAKNIKCYELEKSLGSKLEEERAKCK